MKRLLMLASLVLISGPAQAAGSVHDTYRGQLDTILNKATSAIQDGAKGDYERLSVACSLAKNGNAEAAAALNLRITGLSQRALAWSCLGRAQSKFSNDKAGAEASFLRAELAALAIESSESDLAAALRSVVTDRAESGDLDKAWQAAYGVPESYRFSALERVARIAARKGNPKLAEALVARSTDAEERSTALSLLSIGQTQAHQPGPALAALKQIIWPEHKIAALLALNQARILSGAEHALLVPQALALVQQIESTGDFDYSETIRDHDLGVIALAQLEAGKDLGKLNLGATMQTLDRIEQGSNADTSLRKICELLTAQGQFEKALEIAVLPNLDAATSLMAYQGMLKVLGDAWAQAEKAEADAINKQIAQVINLAINLLNGMSGNDQQWAVASFVEGVARTRNYELAEKIASELEAPRQKAYAYRGLALASMQQAYQAKALNSLELMTTAAGNGPDTASILGQSLRSILDELLEDQPTGFAEAAAGLH